MWRILYSTHGPYAYVQMPCHNAEGSLVRGRVKESARLEEPGCLGRRGIDGLQGRFGISPFPALSTLHPGTRLSKDAKGDELPRQEEGEGGNGQLGASSVSRRETNASTPVG